MGWHQYQSEWICFEHTGYARDKAIAWWRKRSPDPVPSTAQEAVDIIQGGGLAPTLEITVRAVAGEPYERIVGYSLGPMPEALSAAEPGNYDSDEIPF